MNNIKSTKEKVAIMLAYINGKIIERKNSLGKWVIILEPVWNWADIKYRIQPEPVEIWVNIYSTNIILPHYSKESALSANNSHAIRKAVHMIEADDNET